MQWKHYTKTLGVSTTEYKFLKNTTLIFNIIFNSLQALKTRINCHNEDLDVLERTLQDSLKKMDQDLKR